MKTLLLSSATLCSVITAYSQSNFQKYITADKPIETASIAPAAGNEYFICGNYYPSQFFSSYMYIAKLDAQANVLWSKTLQAQTSTDDVAADITAASDGGCVAAGSAYVTMTKTSVVKMKPDGTAEWAKIYEAGNSGNYANKIIPAADSGYIVAGSALLKHGVFSDKLWTGLIFKTTSTGNVLWSKSIYEVADKSNAYQVISLINTNDNGIAILLANSNKNEVMLVKLTSNGSIQWAQKLLNTSNIGNCLIQTSDQGYLAGCYSTSSHYGLAVKFSSTGNVSWSKSIGIIIAGATEIKNKGYIFTGHESIFTNTDSGLVSEIVPHIVYLGLNGELKSAKKINPAAGKSAKFVSNPIKTSAGFMFLGSMAIIDSAGWRQPYFVQTNKQGNICNATDTTVNVFDAGSVSPVTLTVNDVNTKITAATINITDVSVTAQTICTPLLSPDLKITSSVYSATSWKLYPNPAHNNLLLEFVSAEPGALHLRVTNKEGVTVMKASYTIVKGSNKINLNISALHTDMYVLWGDLNGKIVQLKFLKE